MPHNREVPDDRRILPLRLGVAVLVMAALTAAVAALGEWVILPSSSLQEMDEGGVAWGSAMRAEISWLEGAALLWAVLTRPWVVHAGLVVLVLVLLARGRVGPRSLLLVVLGLLGWALGALCKVIVERPRPTAAVVDHSTWSYPSGHSTNIALGTVLLVALLHAVRAAWIRWGAVALGPVVVVLTGLDRVVLGVHYPTDVVIGLALGTALALVGVAAVGVPGPSRAATSP